MNKKILIVGGNSSVGEHLILHAISIGHEITATYSSSIPNKINPQVTWLKLDISKSDQLLKFIESDFNGLFDAIVVLIGKTLDRSFKELSLESIQKFYFTYAGSLNFLISHLPRFLMNSGTLVFLSSRAAHLASFDIHYSAAKAATEALLRSLQNQIGENQQIGIVAPSLINGSKMQANMQRDTLQKHLDRTAGRLVEPSEVVDSIFSVINSSERKRRINFIQLGRDWD